MLLSISKGVPPIGCLWIQLAQTNIIVTVHPTQNKMDTKRGNHREGKVYMLVHDETSLSPMPALL